MAIYSCNLSSVGRTTHAAGTAGCHLTYICRDGAEPLVEAHAIPIDPREARTWMDRIEMSSRANARLIDKIRIAIPRELDADQRRALVRDYVRGITGDRVPWMFAIHQSGDDRHNPHAHIVIHDRDVQTRERVLRLSDSARDREKLGMTPKAAEWVRERWEHFANLALELAEKDARIDRRTLDDQGIEREPTLHLGPRAQHIESFVERPISKKRETALGREIDYPKIDQGRTRRERNAEIIDLNLERRARSPDLETRIFAQFERGQRQLDIRLERTLAEQARSRTRDERALKAAFRSQLCVVADAKRGAYLEGVTSQRERLEVRIKTMRAAHQSERASLHAVHSSFWARLYRAVDITGGTRRRHQEERRALTAAHRKARGALARESRAEWLALKDAIANRFEPEHDGLVRQRRMALSAMNEKHARADGMADAKRQIREAHRERDRLNALAMIRSLKSKESSRSKGSNLRGLSEKIANGDFSHAQRGPTRSAQLRPRPPSRGR